MPARILLQLDPDEQPSSFDAVVAVDAGVEHLLQYHGVRKEQVRNLVYGAIFTRGPEELRSTAIFIGGSNVAAGEELLQEVTGTFFGPMRVSVLLDANGSNTTAAAAVLCAGQHLTLQESAAVVLGGTGPVGLRAARLLAREGCRVLLGSRDQGRAGEAAAKINAEVGGHLVSGHATSPESLPLMLDQTQLAIATGAPGVELLPESLWTATDSLRVLIDLNAVSPVGIGGIKPGDKAKERSGRICYGALGVGGRKMKIHKAAIARLFESNDVVLDAEQIYELGKTV